LNRQEKLKILKSKKDFDFIVIGGGATGLGCALDASKRGYSVALFEKFDFCNATSSRSTKLIHGGVRYLEKFNFKLVYEALKERDFLTKNAPHVVNKIGFIIPVYSYLQKVYYWIGLKIYDLISGNSSFPTSKIINSKKVKQLLPNINSKKLVGGISYFDGQFDDSRLGIDLALTSQKYGALLLNYFSVRRLIKNDGKISGVNVIDNIDNKSYDVRSKVVINCTGVFSESVIKMDKKMIRPIIKPSQGTHVIIDKKFLKSSYGLLIPNTSDGRVLFAIPWKNHLILGTTDNAVDSPTFFPRPTIKEIDYILNHFKELFIQIPEKKDIKSVFSGIRPLVSDLSKKKSKDLSRMHKIIRSESGLISVIGGKWTTFRKISEDVISYSLKQSGLKFHKSSSIDIKILDGLKHVKSKESLSKKINITVPQIIHFIRNEMAINLDDIMLRRSRCLFLDVEESIKIAPKIVKIMSKELFKDKLWEEKQLKSFFKTTKLFKI
jgi:glycerol-3-phosphate dehydrogenase